MNEELKAILDKLTGQELQTLIDYFNEGLYDVKLGGTFDQFRNNLYLKLDRSLNRLQDAQAYQRGFPL